MTLQLYIRNEHEISAIRTNKTLSIRLPRDVLEEIIAFFGDKIDMNDVDHFWISLGIDTHNIDKLRLYCRALWINAFGRSKPDIFRNLCRGLTSKLDDMVACNYPIHRKIIHTKEGNPIKINNIFIGDNALAPKTPYPKVQPTKPTYSLSSQDKQYMETFIEKTQIYIDYLKEHAYDLPIDMNMYHPDLMIYHPKHILKIVAKIETKLVQLSTLIQ